MVDPLVGTSPAGASWEFADEIKARFPCGQGTLRGRYCCMHDSSFILYMHATLMR